MAGNDLDRISGVGREPFSAISGGASAVRDAHAAIVFAFRIAGENKGHRRRVDIASRAESAQPIVYDLRTFAVSQDDLRPRGGMQILIERVGAPVHIDRRRKVGVWHPYRGIWRPEQLTPQPVQGNRRNAGSRVKTVAGTASSAAWATVGVTTAELPPIVSNKTIEARERLNDAIPCPRHYSEISTRIHTIVDVNYRRLRYELTP